MSAELVNEPVNMDLPARCRPQFPFLNITGRGGKQIAYFDSGATAQKPQRVIDALSEFYAVSNGAINRGTHLLADEATQKFDDARRAIARFFGVKAEEIIWTSGATDALNDIAFAFLLTSIGGLANESSPFYLGADHSIVVTRAEHHANLLPWQMLAQATGARLRWLDLTPQGTLDPATYSVIDETTRVVALTHMSNVTGAVSDVAAIAALAQQYGALTVLDTCQSVAHMPVKFAELGVDFCVASAHKMYGPTGVGLLWGRSELLAVMPPIRRGGSMIANVELESAEFLPPPQRFEAGTQPVAQIVGWAEAIRFLTEIGMETIAAHEAELGRMTYELISGIDGVKVLGCDNGREHHGVISFSVAGVHPHDVGQILDAADVAVRVGHHCAIPLHRHFGIPSSTRATLSVTNISSDVHRLAEAVKLAVKFFAY